VRLARLVEESGYPGYLIVHAASTRRAVALVGNPIVPRQARAVSKRRSLLRRAQQGQPATITRACRSNLVIRALGVARRRSRCGTAASASSFAACQRHVLGG
jgi:hypothetical protein